MWVLLCIWALMAQSKVAFVMVCVAADALGGAERDQPVAAIAVLATTAPKSSPATRLTDGGSAAVFVVLV